LITIRIDEFRQEGKQFDLQDVFTGHCIKMSDIAISPKNKPKSDQNNNRDGHRRGNGGNKEMIKESYKTINLLTEHPLNQASLKCKKKNGFRQ
jgi:hypothetical protein